MKIWDAFGHAVTLNFDLLTPKSNQFISVPRCTSDKSLAKIVNRHWRYRGNIKLPRESRTDGRTDGRTDRQRHGRTTRKHIASAGAYRRRRLKNHDFYTTCFTARYSFGLSILNALSVVDINRYLLLLLLLKRNMITVT